jgi:hypothetical protein
MIVCLLCACICVLFYVCVSIYICIYVCIHNIVYLGYGLSMFAGMHIYIYIYIYMQHECCIALLGHTTRLQIHAKHVGSSVVYMHAEEHF